MRVLVATQRQMAEAFEEWANKADNDQEARRRRSLGRVFEAMMADDEARYLIASTGLYCFTLEFWMRSLDAWRDREIRRQPAQEPAIRDWTGQLAALMCSDWPIQHKLLVRECLSDEDLPQRVTAA